MSSEDAVLLNIENAIATVTLNRPDRMNALDQAMVAGMLTALDRIEADIDQIGAVIVQGSGGTFMAGGDVKFFYQMSQSPAEQARPEIEKMIGKVHHIIERLTALPRPVIARLDGAVAGFGISLMNACDLAIAAEETVFTLAYCHIGTSPDGGSTHSLVRLVGMKKAKEIAFLGDRFGADEAQDCGLINKVVPAAQLDQAVSELALRLSHGPRDAIARTKALLNAAPENRLATQLASEAKAFADCAVSDDFREGVTAFVEKRRPQFGKS
ncbi:enoyl-CoA hydratase/isomerase family protein [Thalassospira alkalitolerans]|uniref:Enoyl-CoA hydratase n=1 Tax=Thalassospira alkalitolerans TaxID=1293890 RepID=A0A1Y2LG18_9PROT|nr:enoyl-CoA hydratase [Thalassospira alkalitolerans]OSQ50036.1 enoyl-CoA hydratase [Thalassospira alkalitolerans]